MKSDCHRSSSAALHSRRISRRCTPRIVVQRLVTEIEDLDPEARQRKAERRERGHEHDVAILDLRYAVLQGLRDLPSVDGADDIDAILAIVEVGE